MARPTWKNSRMKLSDLKPWERNPRQIEGDQAARLLESFDAFGQVIPISVGPEGQVYNGHQRLSVLQAEHGPDYELDVRVSSRRLSQKERERLTVFLHKGTTGDWDWDMLANEFEFEDLVDWGFDEGELIGFEQEPKEAPEPKIDEAEALLEKWGVESGQLWQLGDHRVICGDCTDKAVVDRLMEGEKAQLAWFDPPFGIELKPPRGLTEEIENDGNSEARLLWQNFLPMLKENLEDPAHIFLCQGWTEFEWALPLIRKHFRVKSKIVWNKNVWGIGYFTRPKHEDIIYCWNGKPEKIDNPVADVWDVARESAPDHAAEKPPELSGIAIEHFSKINNIVIDWFNGVGGSIVACENLNRKCYGVEIEPKYIAVTIERWHEMTGEIPVLCNT